MPNSPFLAGFHSNYSWRLWKWLWLQHLMCVTVYREEFSHCWWFLFSWMLENHVSHKSSDLLLSFQWKFFHKEMSSLLYNYSLWGAIYSTVKLGNVVLLLTFRKIVEHQIACQGKNDLMKKLTGITIFYFSLLAPSPKHRGSVVIALP